MGHVDYELHTLGWSAFQDLCAVILQQVLGQTFHTFADTNDAGRDGAFYGHWAAAGTSDPQVGSLTNQSGTTVVQCKFSARRSGTLTPSMLVDDLKKAARLHADNLCDAYVVMSNLAVSGRTEQWLIRQARQVGIQNAMILDGQWICQQISTRSDLRRYVPRVYGLGDLGKILDDRRLRQARAVLMRLREDLGTFVPTEAYRRAADAVAKHGFVLLLGEPACGKSTIAATLAVAALDMWESGVRRVDSAKELVSSWDPDEPNQLFWVDDAFGSIRHDPQLTDGWARRMDQVMTAVGQGARVILTSRDYIYRDARRHLKEYTYPRLREQQVVVDVARLSDGEKRKILYNHLKAGDQSHEVLERWRPHLRRVAEVDRFQPEVARRLSLRAFTTSANMQTAADLVRYMERPTAFLADVLRELEPANRAALACVYLAGDELAAPVQFTLALTDAVRRLGATDEEVVGAFSANDGTFLQRSENTSGDPVWRFRHPTIREGFASIVADDINTITIFLDGLSDEELVQQIECGGPTSRGVLVRVPTSLYDRIIPRIPASAESSSKWRDPVGWFLENRCSTEFLRRWAEFHTDDLPNLLNFGMYIDAYWQPAVLARLCLVGILPEPMRLAAVEKLGDYALQFDGGWLDEPTVRLFENEERESLLTRIREEILPDIEDHIDRSAEGYDDDVSPADRYRFARQTLDAYKRAFRGTAEVDDELEDAISYVSSRVSDDVEYYTPKRSEPLTGRASASTAVRSDRDEFDDVADGR